MLAAWTAFQAAQRVIKEAATNNEVTEAIAKACAAYECQPVEGVLSHKVKKHLIDGNDVIINKETPSQQVDEFQFAPGDVIGLDIYVSTGEGVSSFLFFWGGRGTCCVGEFARSVRRHGFNMCR